MHITYAEPNGGFPEPPPGVPLSVVTVRHERCGATTRLRLPRYIPQQAVRRVVCQSCAQTIIDPGISAVVDAPSGPFPRFSSISVPELPLPSFDGPAWRYLSVPLAGAAVIGALVLIQGSDDSPSSSEPTSEATQAPAAAAESGKTGPDDKASKNAVNARQAKGARLVKGSTYSLAMPPGWEHITPPAGATFAAQDPDGAADATLWVKRDPSLDFPAFEAQSLEQLRNLAGSAKVVQRVAAPTAEASVVTLAANAPANAPQYEVTLRQSGPYSYYLATTLQPSANAETADGIDLIQSSFLPQGSK